MAAADTATPRPEATARVGDRPEGSRSDALRRVRTQRGRTWRRFWPLTTVVSFAVIGQPLTAGAEPSSAEAGDPSEGDLDKLATMSLAELLETEVVTATRTAQSLETAPAVISVLTKEDIARRGYQSVAEALRHIVGFYVVDDHVLPNVGVRGVAGGLFGESGTIKVMIDGHSVAFRPSGGNWLGPELVPLSAVERIEIIRGPSSALYGADAFLGVVHIITRQGSDLSGADARASADWASSRSAGLDYDMSAGTRKDAWEFFVAARLHEEDRSGMGLPDTSPAPRVPAYRSDDLVSRGAEHASRVALARATHHYGDKQRLTLVAYHSEFDRQSELSPWTQLPYGLDEDGRLHETRIAAHQTSVGLISDSSIGATGGLTMRGYYFTGGPSLEDRIDVGTEMFEVKRHFGYEGLEGQIEGHVQLLDELGAVFGAEGIIDREELPSVLRVLKVTTDAYPGGEVVEEQSIRQGKKVFSNLGLFAQASWTRLEPHLTLFAGARYDRHSIYESQVSARVGAVSNPLEPMFIKLLYGNAFLAPSPLLLYGVPYRVGDIMGNPDLEPQHAHTVEGQISIRPVEAIALSTGLAYSRLLNQAMFVQRGLNRLAENLAEVESLSWESEVAVKYDRWVEAYASSEVPYAVRDLGQRGYQADLIGSENTIYPGYILRFGVSGEIPAFRLRPGVETVHVGSRRASEMNILERGSDYRLPAYTTLDATLSTVGIEVLDDRETVILVKARNVLDVRGPDPGFAGVDYPLLPFSVLAQLRQQF